MKQLLQYLFLCFVLLGSYQLTLGSFKHVKLPDGVAHFRNGVAGQLSQRNSTISEIPDIQQKSGYYITVGEDREDDDLLRKHLSAKYVATLNYSLFYSLLSEPESSPIAANDNDRTSRIYILQRVLRL